MKNCTHTWVNKGFGDDYCSKCNITKEQLALGLNVEVKEPEVEVKEHEVEVEEPEEAEEVTEVEVKEPKVEVKVAEKSKAAEEVEVKQVTLADIYPAKTTKVGKK